MLFSNLNGVECILKVIFKVIYGYPVTCMANLRKSMFQIQNPEAESDYGIYISSALDVE